MLRVAIVGGGPTGIYALRALLRSQRPFAATIFEAGDRAGLGTPYDPKLNDASLLANIASFELPPIVDSLRDWLASLTANARQRLGVGQISERAFYPRVVLGTYFTAQYRKLVRAAHAAGHSVTLCTSCEVVDVAGTPSCVRMTYAKRGRPLRVAEFDFAILATGHRSRKGGGKVSLTLSPYPAPTLPSGAALRVAVLGASLTAIDAAIAMARQRGDFVARKEGLRYEARPGAGPFKIELLSRRGVLPEADFFFPFPYEPLRWCGARDLRRIAAAPRARLDLAFEALRRELGEQDAEFAARVDLNRLTADSFADAYFAQRAGADPFVAARRNLAEASADQQAGRVSGYRYVLLRAHEAFGELTPHLSQADRERFRRGLQRVFVDNYAAVPPLSVERLLALHAAGVLELRKVAAKYQLNRAADGRVDIVADATETYDFVVDARGERPAQARELPFPTLRLQALANQLTAPNERQVEDLSLTEDLRLQPGVNPVERVFCLASPFLLHRRPFVQGLTSAAAMAAAAVQMMIVRAAAPGPDHVAAPTPSGAIYLGDGLVVTTPAA